MKPSLTTIVAAVCAVVAVSNESHAVFVDLEGAGTPSSFIAYSEVLPGVDMIVTALSVDPPESGAANVVPTAEGLGVDTSFFPDTTDVDPFAATSGEFLIFSFVESGSLTTPVAVEIESITFSNVDDGDAFDLFDNSGVSPVQLGNEIDIPNVPGAPEDDDVAVDLATTLVVTSFAVGADGNVGAANPDNFLVSGISIAAIPEVGSFIAWGAATAFVLPAIRRRSRSADAE